MSVTSTPKGSDLELDALAEAVHRGRFPSNQEPTDFDGLDGSDIAYCYRIARSVASLISAARKGQGEWRPIESAPKDGTRVLLCSAAWEMSWGVQVGHFEDGKWITAEGEVAEDEEWPLGDGLEDGDDPLTLGPTHWMPLPPPSKQEE